MTHKVHPFIFRIGQTTTWKSRWFDRKKYKENLEQDLAIKDYIMKKFDKTTIERVEIERFAGKINVIITTPRPGLIIGRGGSGVEDLKREIERGILNIGPFTKKKDKELKIEIQELKNPYLSAAFLAASIAEQIEKRIPTKRAMKQSLERAKASKELKGLKIRVSGRIDGAEIARREKISWGALPLQTISAEIDYAQKEAICNYGKVGIKVWVYKGKQ